MRNTFKSTNPAFRTFDQSVYDASAVPMTVQGTINKTFILLLLTIFTATISWKMVMAGNAAAMSLMWVGLIGGFITALIAIFSQKTIHITAPIYALFEGLFLGTISAVFTNQFYKAIVLQAVGLTIAVFAVMLILYKLRILQATKNFVKIITIATAGIALYYLVVIGASFFGKDLSVFAMGGMGIIIQLVIVGIAALNFVLDFNFIEQGSAQGIPKKMEWYGAFGLMVTLIWLYLEILRLLALTSRR